MDKLLTTCNVSWDPCSCVVEFISNSSLV